MGCVFATGNFTGPALLLADFANPLRITLRTGYDIQEEIAAENFEAALRSKFQNLCMYGLTDDFRNYESLAPGGQ